ncbi:hypothetical protein EC957_002420 [Mortierella hygrophila]|uniref:Uncharacterized protein n=1 Tax=Mortierella hygrophila TaxID=979708 RepID=A0A9P6K7D3_9FUNG|nr:hypothetical protein EC957_002420 [Mortierella hygrophila]
MPASGARAEVVAAAVEVEKHGGGDDATGPAVPVAVSLGTGGLGLRGDVTAGAPSRDLGATSGLDHGNGAARAATRRRTILLKVIAEMALNKTFSFVLVAVLALVVMSQGAEAVTLPAWCTCSDNQTKTKNACSVAGANYDGGSCGLDQIGKYNAFLMSCSQQQNGSYRCWH